MILFNDRARIYAWRHRLTNKDNNLVVSVLCQFRGASNLIDYTYEYLAKNFFHKGHELASSASDFIQLA